MGVCTRTTHLEWLRDHLAVTHSLQAIPSPFPHPTLEGSSLRLDMEIRLLTQHPIPAGMLAALLLTLPFVVSTFASPGASMVWPTLLVMPLQAIVPLPLFLVSLKKGVQAGTLASAILLVAAFMISSSLSFSLMVSLLFAAFPIFSAWLLRGGWNVSQSASLGFVLGGLLLVILLLITTSSPLEMEKNLEGSLERLNESFLSSPQAQAMDPKTSLETQKALKSFFENLVLLFPATLVSGWFMLQLGNLSLSRRLLIKWKEIAFPLENFSDFKLPFFLVWPLIAMALLALSSNGFWFRFSANMGLFLAIPYFFQGLAILQKAFAHWNVAHSWRMFFYVFLLLSSKIALGIVALGIFDTWLNFRNRFLKTGEGENPSGR